MFLIVHWSFPAHTEKPASPELPPETLAGHKSMAAPSLPSPALLLWEDLGYKWEQVWTARFF